ncbi:MULTISPECIES: exodeoxyribonuclease III [unclassified Polynucleobacter]|uniref:exodeoxyribonuclease III n=1 Tax=unclassified Polynucleobacter TaxID=2640945 RepID=UPI0024914A3D|nr:MULTISPECIES: exodeoxyribonuclease III [unclassified Polynucleobacter]
MLRIITANVNGIRSAAKKGFFEWMQSTHADFICLQEIKAQLGDLSNDLTAQLNYSSYFHCAQKKGYSGTGIYSKQVPDEVSTGFGVAEFDDEGRYTALRFGKLWIISVYFPSGSSSEDRQAAKFRFLEVFLPHLQSLKKQGFEIALCGDINIAHQEIDLKNWKGNIKNSGFLPEERAWMTHLFDIEGFVDVYRKIEPNATDSCYTWWSQRGQAYNNNVGWRIDYHIATSGLGSFAKTQQVYKQERFSDHAPLIIDYDCDLTEFSA